MTRKKAKVGGEISKVNGVFYEGGQFLPDHGYGKVVKKVKGSKKIEIAPYVWVENKIAYTPIWKRINALVNIHNEYEINLRAVEFYGVNLEMLTEYVNLYKNGYRWIIEREAYNPVVTEHTQEYLLER